MERNIERQRTDEDIAWAAIFALEWDTAVPHQQITVVAEDGWLILEGEVNTPQNKSSAQILQQEHGTTIHEIHEKIEAK